MSLRPRLTMGCVVRHGLLILFLVIFGYPIVWMGFSAVSLVWRERLMSLY